MNLLEYIHVLVCMVLGHVVVIGTSLCTTMCSMNLLQAPNQHHFEVLIVMKQNQPYLKDESEY